MTKLFRAALAAGFCAAVSCGSASAQTVRIYNSNDAILGLTTLHFEGGKSVVFSVGIGSAAFRHPKAPARMFWALSDRGPNFTCADVEEITGIAGKQLCGEVKKAR